MAKSSQTPEQNERFTLFAKTTIVGKLDYIARKQSFDKNEKITRTDLVNEALEDFVSKWEKKNGPISLK
jgi:hypothetical protein